MEQRRSAAIVLLVEVSVEQVWVSADQGLAENVVTLDPFLTDAAPALGALAGRVDVDGLALRAAGGRETLFAGSPEQTRTSELLYTSPRCTCSSRVNLMAACLSFFLAYCTVGPMSRLVPLFVSCCRCVTNSVLKTHEMIGSPCSLAVVLIVSQSSRKVDMPIARIVVNGIFRSSEVVGLFCTICDIKM